MATLIRPATSRSKELICKIEPKRGRSFTRPEFIGMLGLDYSPIELPSGDILLVQKGFDQDESLGKNELGSLLTSRAIFGSSIICETGELD